MKKSSDESTSDEGTSGEGVLNQQAAGEPLPVRKDRWKAVREFLYGMMGMDFAAHALEMRASLETLFMLAILGDMLGLPVLPPYYSLRLLPYFVPHIAVWKRRVLRQREFTDEHDYHLEGL
jgi:hypothetical protein